MVNLATLNHICPSCGAPVRLSSLNSKTIECIHCNSLLTLDGDALKDLGRKSFVLKGSTVIKIGSKSSYNGIKFTFIGRYQVGYEVGFWNEWFVLFENGETGWVTDTDNGWYITCEVNKKKLIKDLFDINLPDVISIDLPSWDDVKIDKSYQIFGRDFLSVDISENKIVGVEGEIENLLSIDSFRKAVDLRSSDFFITADYNNSEIEFYVGKFIKKPENIENTRSNLEIINELGSNPNELSNITCPNCGDNRQKLLPNSHSMFCSSCGSEIKLMGDIAKVIDSHDVSETRFSLDNQFVIYEKTWDITGILKREGSDNVWVDYFLTEKDNITNSLWLSESVTYNNFYLSTDLNFVPKFSGGCPVYNGRLFSNADVYEGSTVFVCGTFNWEVSYDDKIVIHEYDFGNNRTYLVKEVSLNSNKHNLRHEEVFFSVMSQVSLSKIGVNELDKNIYKINTKSANDYSSNATESDSSQSSKMHFYSSFVSLVAIVLSPLLITVSSLSSIFFGVIATIVLTILFYPFDPDDDSDFSTYKLISCGFILVVYLLITLLPSSSSGSYHGSGYSGGSSWGGSYNGSSGSYSGGGHK